MMQTEAEQFLVADPDDKLIKFRDLIRKRNIRYIILIDEFEKVSLLETGNLSAFPETRIFADMKPDPNWVKVSENELDEIILEPEQNINGFIVLNGEKKVVKLLPKEALKKEDLKFNEYDNFKVFLKHEIMNLTNGLRGLNELASFEDFSMADLRQYLSLLSSTLVKFSETYLSPGRKDAINRLSGKVLINDIIRDSLTLLTIDFRVNKVQVIESLTQTNDISVTLNQIYLHQILQNLILNSIKYSSGEIIIKISTRLSADRKAFSLFVCDGGKGISQTENDKIFLKDFRGESSRNTQGSGFGLDIISRLVSSLNGTCGHNSPPKHFPVQGGHGVEFWVTLPISPLSGA